ncbi:PTS transporter subunit EIIC [Cellulosilyticum lentocellum]|uniref:PTS system, glucose-like IIB subunint n=1 Tax=Cellulosilyticum lentocellum (strain ATCC 49066 / DSM 5427 / NCIMB 11756 / RHM5) TaxID=642492 RepID=F2JGA8_CELLD|nr:PTS transporter subunit EIIC [Cellulosilyticum lentocellum]ADZ81803.1 PTS system, glucose-like IIB subunint [Cellulosilyticum lentocellum DSM 5427]
MDYKQAALKVLEGIGGKDNLVSGAHCATRLRLVLADNSHLNKKANEAVDGVKGVFEAQGQVQIIFGTGIVNKVFDEFSKAAKIETATKEEVKQVAIAKISPFKRAIKTLGDVFVPIIPDIVASGLLMGLLEGLGKVFPSLAAADTFTLLSLFDNVAFVFLPILIAISTAKVFSGNLFLGAVIGMIMIHPNLINAWNVAGMESIPQFSVWFGLYDIGQVGYQGHVIPIVISVCFMSKLEKKLHQFVPEVIDLFVTPLITVLVTGYLALTVIGSVFAFAENWVLVGVQWLIAIPFGIGSFLMGGAYAKTVVSGVHHMYNVIEAGMISADGINTWMPIASVANVAQGAVALKVRDKKIKALTILASLSAFLGITEPAIFGVNIRYMKPFIAGSIGGACGALVASIFNVGATAYGVTGIFGFLITTNSAFGYLLTLVVAASVAFVISWVLGVDENR